MNLSLGVCDRLVLVSRGSGERGNLLSCWLTRSSSSGMSLPSTGHSPKASERDVRVTWTTLQTPRCRATWAFESQVLTRRRTHHSRVQSGTSDWSGWSSYITGRAAIRCRVSKDGCQACHRSKPVKNAPDYM